MVSPEAYGCSAFVKEQGKDSSRKKRGSVIMLLMEIAS